MDKSEKLPDNRTVKEGAISSIKTEATVIWDVLQHGNVEDPVFEGIVREFMRFDATLMAIFNGVDKFMLGVEHLCAGLVLLSEAMVNGFTKHTDNTIASDICRFREATHKITRMDAPHACIAKLRRDLEYNIVIPLQNHISNNKVIKSSISLRRRRLNEVQMCQRKINQILGVTPKMNSRKIDTGNNQSDIQGANTVNNGTPASRLPPRLLRDLKNAEAALEYAKTNFKAVDRPVFEWLMMLEAYKCDLYDSILQTLKYLQYEFLAESSHSLSHTMPSRMQFRPMVEMTPEQLKPQVDMELEAYGDDEASLDSTATLLKKWERDGGSFQEIEATAETVQVDPLSLASLVSQGFEENLAKKALRMHSNDTQAALDTLLNNIDILENMSDSDAFVRAPTSLKWTKKYKGVRNRDRETRDTEFRDEDTRHNVEPKQIVVAEKDTNGTSSPSNLMGDEGEDGPSTRQSKGTTEQSSMDDFDLFSWGDTPVAPKNTTAAMNESASGELSLMDIAASPPTDLSKGVQLQPLPDLFGGFKAANCEWSNKFDPSKPALINDPMVVESLQPSSLNISLETSMMSPQTPTPAAALSPFDALNPLMAGASSGSSMPQADATNASLNALFTNSLTSSNAVNNYPNLSTNILPQQGGFSQFSLPPQQGFSQFSQQLQGYPSPQQQQPQGFPQHQQQGYPPLQQQQPQGFPPPQPQQPQGFPQKQSVGGEVPIASSGSIGYGNQGNSVNKLGAFNLGVKEENIIDTMELSIEKNKNAEFDQLFGDVLKDF
ncbi:UBA/TS-N domain-containing protein [Cardiosporidium cionae]|uniref:UBA/TS-N domain-containing protein n=1 Tax=Cardiosporidium cionae TaxID=476202 RepID=A0ABQ7J5I6_9APIC|nr:UBA/TS-N domain-containing protein [Cardiosporidium cionae]|eukprot:KAF8818366.1 UBA/TS-N domain-containing protein [Cardiosporidium cionae]